MLTTSTSSDKPSLTRGALGDCSNCGIPRDALLHSNDRDEHGRWVGANEASLLLSCLSMCRETWPKWVVARTSTEGGA